MSKKKDVVLMATGILAGALLVGPAAQAASEYLQAQRSYQAIYVDGQRVQMEAYAINGNNYVKLRDVGQAVGFNVYWDGSVQIDTTTPYTGEAPAQAISPQASAAAQPDGSGAFSAAPFTAKALTGDDGARQDFSQQANPAIFTGDLTRAAYNAARQSILDRDAIIEGNDAEGFNPRYAYAYTTATAETRSEINRLLGKIGSYYLYTVTAEPYLQGYYNYPDYFIVAPQVSASSVTAKPYVSSLIAEAGELSSDAERVRLFNEYLCGRMKFDRNTSISREKVFNPEYGVVKGNCAVFADAFQYLCELSDVPCIKISSTDHTWNAVYLSGQWLHVDVSVNAQATDHATMLLTATSRKTDATPELTLFAKELLVPGSTR